MTRIAAVFLATLAGVPLLAALAWAVWPAWDAAAWAALWADPLTWRAWGLTLWTGLASTALTGLTVAALLAQSFIRQRLAQLMAHVPAWLATPHAAMAIGLVLWLSPSGWALRLVSPGVTGFDAPPPWFTTQDPWGLGLILALWLKEVPFVLWVAATQLQREDLRRRWQAEYALAQTLGHTPAHAFAHVVWPQLAPRLRWPMLAVLAYGLTVVDMALIIGPASPPTLALVAWQWLSDADTAIHAQGVAAAVLLTLSVGAGAMAAVVLRPWTGRAGVAWARWGASVRWLNGGVVLGLVYAAVWFALAVGSVSGVWPFPRVWPELFTLNAWQQVVGSASTVWTTLGLGVASASVCVVWTVAWLELAPRRWQHAAQPWLLLPMVLPSVLWVVGLYSLALHVRWEGQWLGLSLAHAVMVLPFVLLALVPAYQAVDPRQSALVASLGHGRWVYLWRVKWPLLQRAIASAWAVGFAVSVAQYLPTLYVGAGRFATVTTEAVTLAAGSQRSLMSAYAALQMLLPIAAFALAAWLGRPRRFEKIAPMKATP
jgi:putative thiamine transport system permease protein